MRPLMRPRTAPISIYSTFFAPSGFGALLTLYCLATIPRAARAALMPATPHSAPVFGRFGPSCAKAIEERGDKPKHGWHPTGSHGRLLSVTVEFWELRIDKANGPQEHPQDDQKYD